MAKMKRKKQQHNVNHSSISNVCNVERMTTALNKAMQAGRPLFIQNKNAEYYSVDSIPLGAHELFIPYAYTIRVLTAVLGLVDKSRREAYEDELLLLLANRIKQLKINIEDVNEIDVPDWMSTSIALFDIAIRTPSMFGNNALLYMFMASGFSLDNNHMASRIFLSHVVLSVHDEEYSAFMRDVCLNKNTSPSTLEHAMATPALCLPFSLITSSEVYSKTKKDAIESFAVDYYNYAKTHRFSAKDVYPLQSAVIDWAANVLADYLTPFGYSSKAPLARLKIARSNVNNYILSFQNDCNNFLATLAVDTVENQTAGLIEKLAENFDDELETKNAEINTLKKALQTATREKAKLETRCSSLQNQLQAQQSKTSGNKVDISLYEKTVNDLSETNAVLSSTKIELEQVRSRNAKLESRISSLETKLEASNAELSRLGTADTRISELEDENKLLQWRLENTREVDITQYSAELTQDELTTLKSIRVAFFLSNLKSLHELETLLPRSHFCYVRSGGAGDYISAGTNCDAFVCCSSHMGHKQFFKWDSLVRMQGYTTEVTNSTNKNVILRLALDSYRKCQAARSK